MQKSKLPSASIAKQYNSESHPFHLVNPSPWPFLVALSLLFILFHTVLCLHDLTYKHILVISHVTIFYFIYSVANWFYDMVIEGTFEGHHTLKVQRGLRMGMVLFIVSEIMFFFSFFWAFFHSSVSPSTSIGCVWPPLGIKVLNPWGLPFLNTLILLSSGISVTWAHSAVAHSLYTVGSNSIFFCMYRDLKYAIGTVNNTLPINYYRQSSLTALLMTMFLGVLFTLLQKFEYQHASFTMADGMYGSTFYVTTGFHGLHVIIGTLFLLVCFFRHLFYHFTSEHHVGLECAIWYWHFVDVIWLFLFATIYWWGA